MSRKRTTQKSAGFAPTMTVIPSIYVDQYEYSIDGNLIGIRLGRRGETHADVTMPISLLLDMASKVHSSLIPAAPAAEPPPEPNGEAT